MNFFRFLITALRTNFRLSIACKATFIVNVVVGIIKHGFFLAAWMFFFDLYEDIHGWTFRNLLLVYGLISIGIGTIEVFFYGLREIPQIVESHMLDSYLVQPQNIILNIALSKGHIASLSDLITGLIAIIYSSVPVFSFILLLPLSIIFMFALYLYIGSLIFFIKNSSELIKELYRNAIIIATQPNAAYNGLLKSLTLTILPVGFLSFFPVNFTKTSDYLYLVISYAGTLSFLAISWMLFYQGLKRYESGHLLVGKD